MLGVITSSNPRARYLKKKTANSGNENSRSAGLPESNLEVFFWSVVSFADGECCNDRYLFLINHSDDEHDSSGGCDYDHDDGMIWKLPPPPATPKDPGGFSTLGTPTISLCTNPQSLDRLQWFHHHDPNGESIVTYTQLSDWASSGEVTTSSSQVTPLSWAPAVDCRCAP